MSESGSRERIHALDQFRGYTVAGMLLVNFLGSFAVCPVILKHRHDYCSYADTIMPQFLFAVGFAFRLTIGLRPRDQVNFAFYNRIVRRIAGLVLVSIVLYTVSPPASTWNELVELGPEGVLPSLLKRNWFQTLMHIAITSLWILPVIRQGVIIRTLWLMGSVAAHLGLSYWFNFNWVNSSPVGIDGGPFGFLTWSVPMLVGTLVCDAFIRRPKALPSHGVLAGGLALMLLGYGISCGSRIYDVPGSGPNLESNVKLAENPVIPSPQQWTAYLKEPSWRDQVTEPPFIPPPGIEWRKWNYWMMSQRSGTPSYVIFASGFSIVVFCLFQIVSVTTGYQNSLFRTFGSNALAAYVFHDMVGRAVKPFIPSDSPSWYVFTGGALFLGVTWLFTRSLERQNIYFRL